MILFRKRLYSILIRLKSKIALIGLPLIGSLRILQGIVCLVFPCEHAHLASKLALTEFYTRP